MNLVRFSIRTKGLPAFFRRLWTVFTRFGLSETPIRRSLHTMIDVLHPYDAVPTFFIPAVVLQRHAALIAETAQCGAEIGIHGYVHNDYRLLHVNEQYSQTRRATAVFHETGILYQGFRNPYLGWTDESLDVLESLDFTYESNEAVFHDVIDRDHLPRILRDSYDKSLLLFQVIPCATYTLRPHYEGMLLRLPISLPDDEMLVDRLRMTDAQQIGRVWCRVMQSVYDRGGLYVLNLHPERGVLCKDALDALLRDAHNRPYPVWLACLEEIALWWEARSRCTISINQDGPHRWRVDYSGSQRCTLLARNLIVEDQPTTPWAAGEVRVLAQSCTVRAETCPCIGLSPRTAQSVGDFLSGQGYPVAFCPPEKAHLYALYVDAPDGLGSARDIQREQRSALVERIEQIQGPFIHLGAWPNGHRAALAISGDIDSVTIQDFFLRIHEVRQ